MKIAFIIGLYPFQIGGAEMQSLEIAEALSLMGHRITFISYSKRKYTSDKFETIQISPRPSWDFFHLTTKLKLFNALNTVSPDIVYHRAFVPYSCYVAQWCKIQSVPFYFHSADIYTLTRKNVSIKNIISNKFLEYTLKNCTGVICQNNEQELALKRFKINKIKKIYNIHKINHMPINANRNEIVWIGKFIPAKNPSLFVNMAKVFKHDANLVFTMFSSKTIKSEENIRLKQEIENNNIHLIEGKDNDYINNYLCERAAVLVNTSESEGISNTFIQGWMRGIPVLSLNSNPDNWFDIYDIGYCCNGNEKLLDEALNQLLNKIKDDDYKQNLIKFANNRFSSEVIIPQLTKFLKLGNK